MINWADDRIPKLKIGQENFKWGDCWTLPLDRMLPTFIEQLETWKPDLIYSMGITQINSVIALAKKYKIPIGIHVGDPYYASYPNDTAIYHYDCADFVTLNEGQAWNYIRTFYPNLANQCYLLNLPQR